MDRLEQRQILKKLQGMVNNKRDADALKVVEEVREYVATFPGAQAEVAPTTDRVEEESRDRQESKGRTRKE